MSNMLTISVFKYLPITIWTLHIDRFDIEISKVGKFNIHRKRSISLVIIHALQLNFSIFSLLNRWLKQYATLSKIRYVLGSAQDVVDRVAYLYTPSINALKNLEHQIVNILSKRSQTISGKSFSDSYFASNIFWDRSTQVLLTCWLLLI